MIPTLTISPRYHDCGVVQGTIMTAVPCVEVAEEDYHALVIELKAACLALGGSPGECQAVKEQKEPTK